MSDHAADRLLERLRSTHVWRWAFLYGAVAMTATQLVEPIDRAFGPFPEPALRALLILLGAGFPLVLVLAWFHGERGRQRVTRPEAMALGVILAVTGLALTLALRPAEAAMSTPLADPQEFGVAVLPFEHIGHPDDRPRTRGIFAAVSDGLLSVSGLTVMDRSATTVLADSVSDVTRIARRLGVRYLLLGEVQWADRVSTRTLVRLVEGESGRQVDHWEVPARYDSAQAVFQIQESIAGHVARAVGVRVLSSEASSLARVPTADALAMDQYLLAVGDLGRVGLNPDAMRLALDHLEHAVRRDGRYGEAWARLAYLRAMARVQHTSHFPEIDDLLIDEALLAAERYAPRAYETLLARGAIPYLSPSGPSWETAERRLTDLVRRYPASAEGRAMLGFMLRRLDQWPRAIEELEAALLLDPFNYQNLVLTSEALHMVGRFDEAIEVARRADPPSLFNWMRTLLWGRADTAAVAEFVAANMGQPDALWGLQTLHELRGQWEAAIQVAERMPGQEPWVLAALHTEAGNPATARIWADSAIEEGRARLARCPGSWRPALCRQRWASQMGIAYAVVGDSARAHQQIEASRRAHEETHDGLYSTAWQSLRAIAHTRLGEWDLALEELRDLLTHPSLMHAEFMKIAPQLAPLREARPEFTELLDSLIQHRGPGGLYGEG